MKKNKTKKRRSNKTPSAKQLAARRKFALAAKARAKAAKAKKSVKRSHNAAHQHGDWAAYAGSMFVASGKTKADAITRAKKAVKPEFWHELTARKYKAKNPRRKNKTIISKPKRVIVLNPGAVVRRKVRNSFVSLRVHGQAKKTPTGWKLGNKTFPQGNGIVPASRKGYYLDRATGTVFSRVTKNAEKRDADHPIEVTKHWRQGPPGYLTPWQRAHHAGQKQLFDTGIKPAKKRNPKNTSKVRQLRETFTGTASRKTATMNASDGTPANLAKLGKLLIIITETSNIYPAKTGTTWLCADAKGKLHLTTTADRLIDSPARNFGEVIQIEYEAIKPHLGHKRPTIFFHKMGEEGGARPVLIADGKGGLKLRGGSYRIEREGIVD